MPSFLPAAWQDHHALACEGRNSTFKFPLFSAHLSLFIFCPPTLAKDWANLSLADDLVARMWSINLQWVESYAIVARKLVLYYLALGGCLAVGQQNRRIARHCFFAQAIYGRGCPPFSKSSSDNYIKTTLEGYNTSTDIYKLFQYYDFCILINKASNLKDENKRLCDIITPWNTPTSGGKKTIDFETMISIYNKCIIQKDYNIKRIKDCKKNKPNFLCEKNQYTYRVVKLIPYKYQGIK